LSAKKNTCSNPRYLDFSAEMKVAGITAAISVRSRNRELNRNSLAKVLGFTADRLSIPNQIHSNTVKIVDQPGVYKKCDGLVTGSPDIVLSLQVADCIPLYLIDSVQNNLGLIHVGWRGAAAGIVPNAIAKMKNIGSNPSDITVLIGPCILQENFEIGPEVAAHFPNRFLQTGTADRSYFDLPRFTCRALQNCGISPDKLFNTQLDTFSNPVLFHSYRRDGVNAGRIYAVLGWRQ